jgi:hypothetical protein
VVMAGVRIDGVLIFDDEVGSFEVRREGHLEELPSRPRPVGKDISRRT